MTATKKLGRLRALIGEALRVDHVTLNGERLTHALVADDVEGWVRVWREHPEDGNGYTEVLRGDVVFVMRAPGEPDQPLRITEAMPETLRQCADRIEASDCLLPGETDADAVALRAIATILEPHVEPPQ